jgi:hypothetical protein
MDPKIALANTFRLLYNTIRLKGAEIMAIEFKHNGRIWRADTPEEARTLRKQLELDDQLTLEDGDEPSKMIEPVWTPDNVLEFLKSAGTLQKSFLRVLFEGSWVPSDIVLKKLELDSEVAFAGVLSGLSKQLKKHGLKSWNLYVVNVEWAGKSKSRSFRLLNDFRVTAIELGWPEKWV